jgi:hypothetical protein
MTGYGDTKKEKERKTDSQRRNLSHRRLFMVCNVRSMQMLYCHSPFKNIVLQLF